MSSGGWVKLHRKILEWEWWGDPPTRSVFIHLLLSSTHKEIRYCGINLEPGSVVTGRNKIAEEVGLSDKQVRRALSNLEKTGEIRRKRANKYSIITIENYSMYQFLENDQGPAEGQQRASRGPLNKKVRIKEVNNKNIRSSDDDQQCNDRFAEFWKEYPRKVNRKGAFSAFKRNRLWNGEFGAVMDGLRRDKGSEQWSNSKFIPHPTTWINQERWKAEESSDDGKTVDIGHLMR